MAGNKAFGKRVRELREERKRTDPAFSLRQFAERVGISPTFLSKVETGQFDPPSAENIEKMAELLGVDADELLALANRVGTDLPEIIMSKPKAMADFLRTARDLSAEDIEKLTRQAKKMK
jgi:transcriptional regulator with XRE-family HTH domain